VDTLTPVPERLALFPLGAVLFPGAPLALHVFEERYRRLVASLLDLPPGAPRRFGVVAIRDGREVGQDFGSDRAGLHDIGCTAHLTDVTPYSDGRFDILTLGMRRFRLLATEPADGAEPGSYAIGTVEWLPEPEGRGAASRAVAVARLLAGYVATLPASLVRELRLPQPGIALDPTAFSYAVAGALLLPAPEHQHLLAAEDADERLGLAARLLRRETALIGQLRALPLHVAVPGAHN
jgi:Lon protease-like protein